MTNQHLKSLLNDNGTKIILLVLDGLGGLPINLGGKTALEAAKTPYMDKLATEGTLGQTIPIKPGITPGSGPAHLALFGYDPLANYVGRGAFSAAGVGLSLEPGDVAARGNFCTLDNEGKIIDRRAGRISSEEAIPLVEIINTIELPGIEVAVKHVKEYRFAIVMRGEALGSDLVDTDPQQTGVAPIPVIASNKGSQKSAELFQAWVEAAQKLLKDQARANGLTLRGFATDPNLPSFERMYGLESACIAVYPMYRGAAKLAGMEVIQFEGESPQDEFDVLTEHWDKHDFFFVHIKKTDSAGEDGDFSGKKKVIETVDLALPQILDLKPDVLVITGDHSTPAKMRSHSWHPVPLLLWAPERGLPDRQKEFGERACALGGLGTFPAVDTMPLSLAHAGRLNKFGA